MKNKFLGIKIFGLTLILCLVFCGCDKNAIPTSSELKATDKFFVNDYADVISDTDEQEMYKKGVYLNDKTSAQVVVITVESTGDEVISDYALELGRNWGVGDKEKNNGIVILLATQDRDVYISVGYGLEGAIPDSKAGRILDEYGVDYFSNDEFSKGLSAVYSAVYNEVLIEYGISPDDGYVPIDRLDSNQRSGSATVLISWVILIIVIFLYLFVFRRSGFFFFLGGPPMGGGFHGGSSFRGSGGFGGGFRGGGGSFGGGGAGRGF